MTSAPHNKSRYGEEWDRGRLATMEAELLALADLVVVSGGWAWHFISPKGHRELKHAHDHKDLDLFVGPADVAALAARLAERGYGRTWTKYDRHPGPDGFRRYRKRVGTVKVVIDLFIGAVPSVTVGDLRVVEPKFLLSLYRETHSSDQCFAVRAARRLLDRGISPVGREELVREEPG